MTSGIDQQTGSSVPEVAPLSMHSYQDEDCLIVICTGSSDCDNCIHNLYHPMMSSMEDSDCTGLVIDKRRIFCSREKKSINLVAETILRYSDRAVLRKLAIVTTIEYKKDEQLLMDILFQKGINIRLFTELEPAVRWAKAYP